MSRIALATFLVLATLAPNPADARCHLFSVWRYPWPQRCGVLHSVAASSVPDQEHPGNEARLVRLVHGPAAIALPSLVQADLDGGAADEPTRARLLLRAALEAANGH
jgi:hypothetical protein